MFSIEKVVRKLKGVLRFQVGVVSAIPFIGIFVSATWLMVRRGCMMSSLGVQMMVEARVIQEASVATLIGVASGGPPYAIACTWG